MKHLGSSSQVLVKFSFYLFTVSFVLFVHFIYKKKKKSVAGLLLVLVLSCCKSSFSSGLELESIPVGLFLVLSCVPYFYCRIEFSVDQKFQGKQFRFCGKID